MDETSLQWGGLRAPRRLPVIQRSLLGFLLVLPAPLLLAACGGDEPKEVAAAPEVTAQVEPRPPVEAAPAPAAVEVPAPAPAGEAPPTPEREQPAMLVPLPADQNAVPDANGNYFGIAEAVEGDVIRLGRTRILLYGIDTVEPPQICSIKGQPWECWAATVRELQTILAEGPVTCTPTGRPDMFGRILALCEVNGESVNARMVRSGFALAWADEMPDYVPLQGAARQEGIGLWQGEFQQPQEYREGVGHSERRP